jgi:hypothetical protein
VIDPRTELASVLVRLKYGGDRVLGDRAALLLVHWVRHQKAYTNWSVKPRESCSIDSRSNASAEWLFPVCQACDGRALLGADRGEIIERKIRCTRCSSSGLVTVKKVRRICLGCGGSGWKTHRRVRHRRRASARAASARAFAGRAMRSVYACSASSTKPTCGIG